jgi:hypothetical protein
MGAFAEGEQIHFHASHPHASPLPLIAGGRTEPQLDGVHDQNNQLYQQYLIITTACAFSFP